MSKIIIADGQTDKIYSWINKSNILENKHVKSMKDTVETFDFQTYGDQPFSQHLFKRNRIVIPDEDGKWIEFIISESVKYHNSSGILLTDIFGRASYVDLKKSKVIAPMKTEALSAESHARNALAGTEWEVGNVSFNGVRTFTFDTHLNPYTYLKKIASEFDLELHFRVEVDYYRVSGRYVDIVEKAGIWRGRTVEFGKDLLGIRRIEKTDQIVTALKGIGPEKEDGTRLEVFVEDKDALARWGRNGNHLIEVYEPQSTDQDMSMDRLTTLTENELQKRVNATVEYEAEVADLEHVPGMENKKIRFGDTIKIKDVKFYPPLYLEARVHTLERNIIDKSQKKVILGDYIEYTEDEVKAVWKSLQAEIRKKVSMAELKEVTYDKLTIDEKDKVVLDEGKSITESVRLDVKEYADTQDQSVYQDSTLYADQQKKNLKNDVESGGVKVPTTSLEGAIKLANNVLENASSTVYTDEEGNFYFVDSRNVVKITSKGIGVSSNGVTGPFTNALTGRGLNATAIVTGVLNADVVKIENNKVIINEKGVNVKNGAFTLEDQTTGIKSILRENSNMIADHSFELIVPHTSIDPVSSTASIFTVNQDSLLNSPWSNSKPAEARLMVSFDASTETLFGQRAVILRGLDYGTWDQIVQIPAQFKHTNSMSFSAFVAPFERTTYDVEVSMRMQLVTKNGAWVQDLNTVNHIIDHADKYNWTRLSVSYNGRIPKGDYNVRLRIFLNNNKSSAMLLCDGVQLVPFEHPTLYYPETQVFRALTGTDKALSFSTNDFDAGYAAIDTLWVNTMKKQAHAFANLRNGWVPYGGSFQYPRYTKLATGMVYLAGLMKGGLVGKYTAFILPKGCRPNMLETFRTNGSRGGADVYVYPNGDVRVISGNAGHVSLSGICFLGEN
ncbi:MULTISPECIES: phage tail spike protein [Clostridia]|uniref:phage tail spike protein n=1 Tax=Clostridia TaxID=186801 RepID=UPI000EA2BA37|nr:MULTISPECIES: phage tail spike protein [Clostridia]NBJ71349.1 hypothetical protein [Roseburia sp. 1XD42-34]RKI74394.1 hypothetical protein D7V87_18765 [Clostridium sp. 1xD42-85]